MTSKLDDVTKQLDLAASHLTSADISRALARASNWFADHPPFRRTTRERLFGIESAADQGDASAQYNLGLLYDQGHGVPQDYGQAAWYRNAAEQGQSERARDPTRKLLSHLRWSWKPLFS